MSEKLKNVAKKLITNIKHDVTTPQEFYRLMNKIYLKNQVYFAKALTPIELVILSLYMYSYKNYGSFEWTEKILDDISFMKLFSSDGKFHRVECEMCDGRGTEECDSCSGSGWEDCGNCDGEGKITCDSCDGSGEIEGDDGEMEKCDECEGKGEIECDDCDGKGRVDCSWCGGDGDVTCTNCDGEEEVETDTKDYILYNVCSWNKDLNAKAEIVEGTLEPLGNWRILDYSPESKLIVLSKQEADAYLNEDIEENELYCIILTDTPNLKNTAEMQQEIEVDRKKLSFLSR